MNILWRLIREELPAHWKSLMVVFVITLLVSATPYGFAIMGRWLVDDVLQVARPTPKQQMKTEAENHNDAPEKEEDGAPEEISSEQKLYWLMVFGGGSMAIHLLITAISICSALVNQRIVQRVTHRMRRRVHEKLGKMDLISFSREQVGQLMSRVMDDTAGIPANLTNMVINGLTQSCMLLLGAVLLYRMNPLMMMIVCFALPLYGLVCLYFLPRLRKNTEDMRVRGAAFNGHIIERLTNIRTIKNYAQEGREEKDFNEKLSENQEIARHQNRLNLWFNTYTTLITAGAGLVVLVIGYLRIRSGEMQLGEVLAFNGITAQLFVPISVLVSMMSLVQSLQVLGDRVYGVLDSDTDMRDGSDANVPGKIRGEVEFENVSVKYQEKGPFAVEDINCTIPAGSTTYVVGPTGCGKSTLLSLLTRLCDPSEGVVRLDGKDIQSFPVKVLRRAVAQVFADCPLFTGTVAENIAFGAPDAKLSQIISVARTVGLHDFIESLPSGYETMVGGEEVTMGEEQIARLGLARAIVVEPAVVTIDDTYSKLAEGIGIPLRNAVQEALSDLTIIVATSSLSICHDAGQVLVMQQGQLVQCGSHAGLMETAGPYRRMYMREMGWEEVQVS